MKNKYIKLFEDIDWEEWDYEEKDPFFLDEFIDNEKFYEFLKENNCLNEWIYEMNKLESNIKDFLNYHKNRRKSDFGDYIDFSFSWDSTEYGHSFWEKIYYKGKKIYENT